MCEECTKKILEILDKENPLPDKDDPDYDTIEAERQILGMRLRADMVCTAKESDSMTEVEKNIEKVACPECDGKGGWVTPDDAEQCQGCEGKGKVVNNMICPKEKCRCVLQYVEGSAEWVRYCPRCKKVIHPNHYMKEEYLSQKYLDCWIEHMAWTAKGTIERAEYGLSIVKMLNQAIALEHGEKQSVSDS